MTASPQGSPSVIPEPDQPDRPVRRALTPLREFLNSNAAGGVVLLGAALVALVWSNSPFADSYFALWESELHVGIGDYALTLSLGHWINDGLMAIFFLLVGLEIKRELLVGELASPRRALLPVAAAFGGAVVPALIFLAIASGSGEGVRGWGVPMATDIAFAIGVLAVLGDRVPLGLRIFVTALAIADDLVAVLVIAFFYTADLSLPALAVAALLVAALLLMNRAGVRQPLVYIGVGFLLWLAVLQSGVHATIAGVLLAMTIPAGRRDDAADLAGSPMSRIEHSLARGVAFLIVPLFGLANAGVAISSDVMSHLSDPVVMGVAIGLVVGKQIGITTTALLVVRAGLASLPHGVSWRQLYGAAWVCGIGFTMSIFIANLAYGDSSALELAKVGILGGSVVAGLGGYLLLRAWSADPTPDEPDLQLRTR
jgi:NhaA family Na+:H+ antiporter